MEFDRLRGFPPCVGGGESSNSAGAYLCAIAATHDGGDHWRSQGPPVEGSLNSVTFVDALHGWAVGSAFLPHTHALILATRDGGAHWLVEQSSAGLALTAVDFVDASHGWAIGDDTGPPGGAILATTDGGAHWATQAAGDDYGGAGAVTFVDRDHGWVALADSIAVTTDGGRHWLRRTIPAMEYPNIHGIAFVDTRHGWAVGGGGEDSQRDAIWATSDGGAHWSRQDEGTFDGLGAVAATDPRHAWAAGKGQSIVATAGGGRGTTPPRTFTSTPLAPSPPESWVKVAQLSGVGAAGDMALELKGSFQKIVLGRHDKSLTIHLTDIDHTGFEMSWFEAGNGSTDTENWGPGRYTMKVECAGAWTLIMYDRR